MWALKWAECNTNPSGWEVASGRRTDDAVIADFHFVGPPVVMNDAPAICAFVAASQSLSRVKCFFGHFSPVPRRKDWPTSRVCGSSGRGRTHSDRDLAGLDDHENAVPGPGTRSDRDQVSRMEAAPPGGQGISDRVFSKDDMAAGGDRWQIRAHLLDRSPTRIQQHQIQLPGANIRPRSANRRADLIGVEWVAQVFDAGHGDEPVGFVGIDPADSMGPFGETPEGVSERHQQKRPMALR